MDKVKINKAIDGLGLSVDNKNTLKEALNQDYETDISNLETRVDNFINANEIIINIGIKIIIINVFVETIFEYILSLLLKHS